MHRRTGRKALAVLIGTFLVLSITTIAHAGWQVAPNPDGPDRPAYWVADVNGTRVEAVLNDYRIAVGTPCLGAEVRTAGTYSLRWLHTGPDPIAAICQQVDNGNSQAGLSVTWTPPTSRTDGSPISAIDHFTIYSTFDGDDRPPVQVVDATATSYRFDGLPPGTWCETVTAWELDRQSARPPPACVELQ